MTLTLELDENDARDVHRAIAARQSRFRYDAQPGAILPDGESNTAGKIIAEICRGWLESLGETI